MSQLEELKEVFEGKPVITVNEASQYLRMDPRTLKAPKYKFPYRKRGKRYLVSLVAMAQWMAEYME
jgi:hypothetical protein